MRKRVYAVVGVGVGAVANILINLVAAVILENSLYQQLVGQSIWMLVACLGVCLLLGLWLGGSVSVPADPQDSSGTSADATSSSSGNQIEITRLTALLSYGSLRGRGIRLQDILLIGSRLDINQQ